MRLVPFCWISLVLSFGCATPGPPPLTALERPIELERFMGDWYVLGSIPIALPFADESGAHNAVESYRLTESGVIETTYTFRDGAFDGPLTQFTPRAWVFDEATNAEWRMQFVWPFRSAYLIAYLDDDYTETIVGVPDRSFVWILARDPSLPEVAYQRLVGRAEAMGYDVTRIRRVPQRWPASREGVAP